MKIPFTFIPKLNNLTNCEMKLIFWLLERKNARGVVFGVRVGLFKQMMAKQSFYNALQGLIDKGLIYTCHHKNTGDYDILIYDCSDKNCIDENGKACYINLNREIFRSDAFQELTSKAKYMMLNLYHKTSIKINSSGVRATHEKYMNEFYKKYGSEMKRTKRRIREYLHDIKQFFNVNLKKGFKGWIYVIGRTRLTYSLDKKMSNVATKERRKHFVQTIFNRYKLKASDNAINDVAHLFITYKPDNETMFEKQLERAIITHARDKNKEVSPARIHELLRNELGFPAKETIHA